MSLGTSAGTIAYSPRWPSFAVLAIAAFLLGASYMVMSAYTRVVNPEQQPEGQVIGLGGGIDIDMDIDPLPGLTPVAENLNTSGGTTVFGIPAPVQRPEGALSIVPAPMPIDQSYRVVIRATGRALITVFDARTGRSSCGRNIKTEINMLCLTIRSSAFYHPMPPD